MRKHPFSPSARRVSARKRQFHYRGTATTLRWKGAMLSPQEAKALARASVARQSPRASARGVATGAAQMRKRTKNGACPPTFRRRWPTLALYDLIRNIVKNQGNPTPRRQTPTNADIAEKSQNHAAEMGAPCSASTAASAMGARAQDAGAAATWHTTIQGRPFQGRRRYA